jgi:hypothetical protein
MVGFVVDFRKVMGDRIMGNSDKRGIKELVRVELFRAADLLPFILISFLALLAPS